MMTSKIKLFPNTQKKKTRTYARKKPALTAVRSIKALSSSSSGALVIEFDRFWEDKLKGY